MLSRTSVAEALRSGSNAWPGASAPPSPTEASTLDPSGPWGAAACGVEVRPCVERPHKGMGVFATQRLPAGSVAGVYAGETLSVGAYRRRHESKWCERAEPERARRLASLGPGRAPFGGHRNGGAYVVSLASQPQIDWAGVAEPERLLLYIDAECAARVRTRRERLLVCRASVFFCVRAAAQGPRPQPVDSLRQPRGDE